LSGLAQKVAYLFDKKLDLPKEKEIDKSVFSKPYSVIRLKVKERKNNGFSPTDKAVRVTDLPIY
jgi:hypothetical protein